MGQGRSLELFFIDGNPEGMLTAEVFNWTGHVLMAPRVQIKEALLRPEAGYTGIYVLLGELDETHVAYVGEGENVAARIRNHDAEKDWWDEAIIITSAANNLHKAHVKYLESRLVETARSVNAIDLLNGNTPPRSSLSEAAQANMEEFLATLFIVLPALGITFFTSKRRSSKVSSSVTPDMSATRFVLNLSKHEITAYAELRGGEFIVLEGSSGRNQWAGKGDHDSGYRKLHEKLVAVGVIDDSSTPAVFRDTYAFNSPSAAAAVVTGRPANGRTEWRVEGDGRTFKEWEAAQLNEIVPGTEQYS